MRLPWPAPHELEGRGSWCGRNGCLTQTKLDIRAIAKSGDASDLVASSVLQVLDDRTGHDIAAITSMFEPYIIILGGRIAELNRLYVNVPRKWPGYLLIERSETQLLKASDATFALAQAAALLVSTGSDNKKS